MKRRFTGGLASTVLAVVCTVASASTAEAGRVHRKLFYTETPFGSLAWVRGPARRSGAESALRVHDLSNEPCVNLPSTGPQWFVINHRAEEFEGQVGYFSVRILYEFAAGATGTRTGIHLQRNGNWFDASGNQISKEYQRHPEQVALSSSSFFELHNPMAGKEEASLASLEQAIGNWHMKPKADEDSSWSDRYLYGPMLKAYLRATDTYMSVRHIRFTATAGSNTQEPVLFWLDPAGATSATILVDAPRHTHEGARRVYTVNFENACPE